MIILVKNLNTIILGPMEYSRRYFQSIIKDELDLDIDLPVSVTGYLDLNNNLEIYPVTVVQPNYNSKIEQLSGPFYNFSGETCTATYNVVPKDIDAVKNELKATVAANRYKKEIGGVDKTIQGQTVRLLTGREDRNLYLQAFQLNTADISWKFNNELWLILSLAELGEIVATVMNHTKTSFEEEVAIITTINNCTTLEQLDAVGLELS